MIRVLKGFVSYLIFIAAVLVMLLGTFTIFTVTVTDSAVVFWYDGEFHRVPSEAARIEQEYISSLEQRIAELERRLANEDEDKASGIFLLNSD